MRFISDTRVVDATSPQKLQVIAAGLPRCGTSSLQAALESSTLGFNPTMHMAHIAPHADRERLVIAAMRETDTLRRQKLLHKIFDGYVATTDFPGMIFVPDLMDMYPDAKIVLNTRASAVAWSKSITENLAFFGGKTYLLLTYLIQTDRLHYEIHQEGYAKMQRDLGLSREDVFSPKHYEVHNQWIREEAAKRGKVVLEHASKDGWKPLCEFLEREAPEGLQYPWLNDSASIRGLKAVLILRGLLAWAALAGSLYALWYLATRFI